MSERFWQSPAGTVVIKALGAVFANEKVGEALSNLAGLAALAIIGGVIWYFMQTGHDHQLRVCEFEQYQGRLSDNCRDFFAEEAVAAQEAANERARRERQQ
jgi:hypothetical protein